MREGRTATVRVATYNVRNGRGVGDVARVIRELDADVVCLQQAPRWLRWRSRCAALARQAGLVYVAGSGTVLLGSHRTSVLHTEDFPLPSSGLAPGSAAVAVLGFLDGRRLAAGSMRLVPDEQARLRHLDLVVRRLESLATKHGASYVLGGDVGAPRSGAAWQQLAAQVDGIFAGPDVTVVDCSPPATGNARPVAAELQLPDLRE